VANDDHNTVNRVADILEFLPTNKGGSTFSEIAKELSIPKSSLHPVLRTLCKRRLVFFREYEQRYFLGDKIFSLGTEYGTNSNLLNLLDDELAVLAKNVSETCQFGVLAGNEVLYLLKQNPASMIYIASRPGFRLKAYGSAIGKALLSQFDKSELMKLYPDGLEPITENTIKDVHELYAQLCSAKQEEFFYEKEESSPHVQCIAVPIFYQQRVIAAISVAFPVFEAGETPEKIQIIRENLALARQKSEGIISRNRKDWIY
jgi:DNA-binding IclR family transcriptional regulator